MLRNLIKLFSAILVMAAFYMLWTGGSIAAAIGQILIAIWLLIYSGIDQLAESLRGYPKA